MCSWRETSCLHMPFAFKDSVIEWFCNWYHLSHFAAFFNEIGSQVIHRDTLWEPSSTVVGRHLSLFVFDRSATTNPTRHFLFVRSGIHRTAKMQDNPNDTRTLRQRTRALEPLSEYRTQSLSGRNRKNRLGMSYTNECEVNAKPKLPPTNGAPFRGAARNAFSNFHNNLY